MSRQNKTGPVTEVETTGPVSSGTQEILNYIEKHDLTSVLNDAVNKLCREKPDNPWDFLAVEIENKNPCQISKLEAHEILDSRGNPTIEVSLYVGSKILSRGSAPSGASTGSNEALELRDGDEDRYMGKGTLKAVENVNNILSESLQSMDPRNLRACDEALCKADGTQLKENIGGNAITASSFAIAEAGAKLNKIELFQHFANAFHQNSAGLRYVTTVYHHLGKILVESYGKSARNLGDEGGFAPPLKDANEALKCIEKAIETAGFQCGTDIFLALDCAASEFYHEEKKQYEISPGKYLDSTALIGFYENLVKDHPALVSIEDGLHEKDYEGWINLTERLSSIMCVGDDLYTTNTDLIKKGIKEKWANALLLKVNQIGTISEAMEAARLVFAEKCNVIVSHRSGETPGSLIADLAVGIGAQYIKTGAPARGERISKYNRLLQIENFLKSHDLLFVNETPIDADGSQTDVNLSEVH
uniref:Enolase n=2 Tax=Hirondellea gigas TaxID=1518452 RepID=A0A2R5L0F2_9CRUS